EDMPVRRHLLDHGPGAVYALAYGPQGRWLASGGLDGAVRLWDPKTGGELWSRKEHQVRVRSLAYSPDGRLASADDEGRVLLCNPAGEKLGEILLPGAVRGLAFARDGRHLATANANGTVYLLRLAPPTP